jgi:hypothetical protein
MRLMPGHAFTGMDLVALVSLTVGGWVALTVLLGRSHWLSQRRGIAAPWLFVAGLALGLALAIRFP